MIESTAETIIFFILYFFSVYGIFSLSIDLKRIYKSRKKKRKKKKNENKQNPKGIWYNR